MQIKSESLLKMQFAMRRKMLPNIPGAASDRNLIRPTGLQRGGTQPNIQWEGGQWFSSLVVLWLSGIVVLWLSGPVVQLLSGSVAQWTRFCGSVA